MKTLQTIQELCVSVVDKEATKVAMEKKGFSLEEKKNIANSFKCLLSKTELRADLRFILRCMDEEWELASEAAMDFGEKCDWEPSHSQYYTMANILLYLNDYKTFKQFKSGSWADLMSIVTDELSQ